MSANIVALLSAFRNDNRGSDGGAVVFGRVLSLAPLTVQVNQNLILTESFLILGQLLKPFEVTMPHTHEYSGETENTSLTITGQAQFAPNSNPHLHNYEGETEDVKDDIVTVEIHPKLTIGDTVLMFALNDSQKYYIMERILQ